MPESPQPTEPRNKHYPELDAARGLAALAVVLGHFLQLWPRNTLTPLARFLTGTVFVPFFNGGSSVVIFFVLSGFVLALPYKRGAELPFRVFALRRLARIYLPYLAALLLALLAESQFHRRVAVSPWFSRTWTAPLTPGLILNHILLIGNYDTAQVNTAFWSLAVEMRLSLLFPLLCIPLLRFRAAAAGGILISLLALDAGLPHLLEHRMDRVSFANLHDMSLGLACFAAGILLARSLERLSEAWQTLSFASRALLAAGSFGLLEWSQAMLPLRHVSVLTNACLIAGGCGTLAVVLCWHRAAAWLHSRLPAWLGRISYSLYLVHATVLFSLVSVLFGRLSRMAIFIPYISGSLLLASLFFHLVERPCITLSRSIGRKGRMFQSSGRTSANLVKNT